MDPVTANKVAILGEDFLPKLLDVIDISQIPEELGGERKDFRWTYPGNYESSVEHMRMAVPDTDFIPPDTGTLPGITDELVNSTPIKNVTPAE